MLRSALDTTDGESVRYQRFGNEPGEHDVNPNRGK